MKATIDEWVDAIRDEVIAWRRHLHKHPELSFQEKTNSAVCT